MRQCGNIEVTAAGCEPPFKIIHRGEQFCVCPHVICNMEMVELGPIGLVPFCTLFIGRNFGIWSWPSTLCPFWVQTKCRDTGHSCATFDLIFGCRPIYSILGKVFATKQKKNDKLNAAMAK